MNLKSASLSDVGRVRRQNEDSLAVLDDERVFLVADGMGGHAGGKRASETAVETVIKHLRHTGRTVAAGEPSSAAADRQDLVEGIHRANRRILELARADSSLHGMGTTVAALVVEDDTHGAIVHVGDSRVYRLRGDRFEQLTSDHSLVADLVRRGEISDDEAKRHPYRHTLTRALGAGADVQPEVLPIDLAVGDLYLLCSDGVYGMLDQDELRAFALAARNDPPALCKSLIDAANAAGGKDNASVIAVVCGD
jgi:protein phosphatase